MDKLDLQNRQNRADCGILVVAPQLNESGKQQKIMLRNFFKTAIRNILRHKTSTSINIAGLTLGITCSLLLFLLIRHLSSFDNYHANRDKIFRVVTESDGNNEKFHTSGVPRVLPDAFRNDFPEAEEVTFLSEREDALIRIPQRNGEAKKFQEAKGVFFGEPSFFKIFDRKILSGTAEKGLDEPNEAIISTSLAKKYFGRDDVIGEVISYDTMDYKITAVMEDHPANTDLPLTLVLSYISIKKENETSGWTSIWSGEQCYIKLKQAEDKAAIEKRIPDFVNKYVGKENYSNETFLLQPLTEMHYDDRFGTYSNDTVPREMLIALTVIALFLLVTACINFINLSTAEAIKRSKEVGVRKTLGSSRAQLITQFLGETTLITTISMCVSIGLAQLALTFLNAFLELKLSLNFAGDTLLWVFVIGVTVLVSLFSGLYPSFVISGFRPAAALKNQISNKSTSGYFLRRGLVVLQFFISQFLIIGTIVLINQMNFFQKKELGFKKDAILILPIPTEGVSNGPDGQSKKRALREEISRLPGVEGVSLSNTPPSSGHVNGTGFIFEGESDDQRRDVQLKLVDGNYIDLYEIKMLAGSGVGDYDTINGFVVNEQFAKVAGYTNPNELLGKRIRVARKTFPIIGVVQDFHTVSLHGSIEPTVLLNRIVNYTTISVKVNMSEAEQVIAGIKTKWEAAYPEHIFEYQFLDEHIRQFYEGEQKMSILMSIFTSMAIFIGCLGLFGLASFMVNQKTKEIGVRKALGATVESILFLFSKEYLKLILIGFAIAAPLAWFVMNAWLSEFKYKITIGVTVFIFGLAITLVIAMLTVGYKSLKAAIVNPVKSLRYE